MKETSPQNRLISFMERKSELLNAKNKLFTAEDAEELLSWPDDQAERVIAKILKEDFSWDIFTCPWCILFTSNCNSCSFAQRHGVCNQRSDTYTQVLEALQARCFTDYLTPHKTELLALLRGEKEKINDDH